ncbi:MAG TPA: hypothetical protein VNS19_14975 [Acidimicrobiales bacterium]|nr:hypothetical protein [Acidimicrobiales bacterium]
MLAATIAVFGASVGFDLGAVLAKDQFIYTQGAFTLIGFGIVVGLVGVVLLVLELAGWAGSPDRRAGVAHLISFDALLLWFVLWFAIRRPHPVRLVEVWAVGLSGIVVLAAAVLHLRYLRLLARHDAGPGGSTAVVPPVVPDVDREAPARSAGPQRSGAPGPQPAEPAELAAR